MNKTTNETVQSMQHLDSLRAVKVAMDMNKAQDKTIDMLVNLVGTMDKNMKLLAVKVLELEKICARYQMTVGADEKEKANDWTCPVCEQETKPDWWSSDGYSCQDCGPVLDEYEEPAGI